MHHDQQDLDYPFSELLTIHRDSLQIVDAVLLAALGRTWERLRDITPHHRPDVQAWSSSPEELRSSRLGQALLTIADYADGGFVATEKVRHAMKQVCRMLFGDVLSDNDTIPDHFHTTDLGKLFHAAYCRMYRPEDLMTPVQTYRTLGIARQTLYDRLKKGKLTPIYWYGELRFLRAEIEAWKAQREQ